MRFSQVPVLAVHKACRIASIKNILFPTTGDFNRTDFISKVKSLQEFLKAKLHVLLVNTPVSFKRDEDGKETLEEFAKHYQLKNYALHFKSYRNEEEGIIDFAISNKMDLIVMATHSRRGLSHLLAGSITEDVVNRDHSHLDVFNPEVDNISYHEESRYASFPCSALTCFRDASAVRKAMFNLEVPPINTRNKANLIYKGIARIRHQKE